MTTQNLKPKRNLGLIQLLRGVASLLVVLMHATVTIKDAEGVNLFGGFFNFGGAGVDIFFVLSGFIITYTNNIFPEKKSAFGLFLKRRFVRIFPVYWIIITIFLAIQISLPSFYRTHYDVNLNNLLATYLLLPGHQMINGVSWTLSYELFFYFLFSMAFIIRNKKQLWFLSITYLSLIILFSSVGGNLSENKWISFTFFPMITEFFMGILAALIIPKLPKSLALPFLIIGSCTFIGLGIYSDQVEVFLFGGFNRVVIFGIPSFFIITGIVRFELSRVINLHNLFILMGRASYSLYLLHLPILTAGIKIGTMVIKNNAAFTHFYVTILIIGICYLSIIFFNYIEKPVIDKINKW